MVFGAVGVVVWCCCISFVARSRRLLFCLIGGFSQYRLLVYLARYIIYVRKGRGGKGEDAGGERIHVLCPCVFSGCFGPGFCLTTSHPVLLVDFLHELLTRYGIDYYVDIYIWVGGHYSVGASDARGYHFLLP